MILLKKTKVLLLTLLFTSQSYVLMQPIPQAIKTTASYLCAPLGGMLLPVLLYLGADRIERGKGKDLFNIFLCLGFPIGSFGTYKLAQKALGISNQYKQLALLNMKLIKTLNAEKSLMEEKLVSSLSLFSNQELQAILQEFFPKALNEQDQLTACQKMLETLKKNQLQGSISHNEKDQNIKKIALTLINTFEQLKKYLDANFEKASEDVINTF